MSLFLFVLNLSFSIFLWFSLVYDEIGWKQIQKMVWLLMRLGGVVMGFVRTKRNSKKTEKTKRPFWLSVYSPWITENDHFQEYFLSGHCCAFFGRIFFFWNFRIDRLFVLLMSSPTRVRVVCICLIFWFLFRKPQNCVNLKKMSEFCLDLVSDWFFCCSEEADRLQVCVFANFYF